MERILAGFALAASLALAGCNGWAPGKPIVPPDKSIQVAKAEYGFEATYNAAASAYLKAVQDGTLTGENKDKAKALLQTAYKLLLVARKAQAAGDADTLSGQVAAITALTGDDWDLSMAAWRAAHPGGDLRPAG